LYTKADNRDDLSSDYQLINRVLTTIKTEHSLTSKGSLFIIITIKTKQGEVIMYLDETILQSRTALSLVDFIDVLIEKIGPRIDKGNYQEIKKDYIQIKEQSDKARKKRSFK